MKKIATLIVALISATWAFAQSPTQLGGNYAKEIVNNAVKGNYESIADSCMDAFLIIDGYTKEEYDAFMAGFAESAYAQCRSNDLGEKFADNLVTTFKQVMSERNDESGSEEE